MLRLRKNWQTSRVRPVDEIVKTMIFKVDGEYIMVLVRGHHEINDIKLKSYFGTDNIELATQDEIGNLVGANPGSLGPVIDKRDQNLCR